MYSTNGPVVKCTSAGGLKSPWVHPSIGCDSASHRGCSGTHPLFAPWLRCLFAEPGDVRYKISVSLPNPEIELSCYNTEFGLKSTLLFAVIQFRNGYLLQDLHLVSKYFFHLVSKYFDTWRSHISH